MSLIDHGQAPPRDALALSLQENRWVTGLKNGVEGWRLFMLGSIEITTLQERICRPLENQVQRRMRAPRGAALRKWRNAHR
jgi:hypothetical protein